MFLSDPQEKVSHCLDQNFDHRTQTHDYKVPTLILDMLFKSDLQLRYVIAAVN